MAKKYNLFLPKTEFSEKIKWQDHQLNILKFWESMDLQKIIDIEDEGNHQEFILHLGPPYATGDLHKGHLLNYILKDFTIRGFRNLGYKVHARQGWDCHGLPIEMKVEALYKDPTNEIFQAIRQNQNIENNPVIQFRKDCKSFAEYWIKIQKQSLKMLGFSGNLDNYYTTMDKASQLSIIQGLLQMISQGWVSRKKKVTMWSTVEKTTLSEAEIQYKDDHKSISLYFVTKITHCPLLPQLNHKLMTVWTTTPWTLPGNNGYAYHNDLTYQLVQWGIFLFVAEKSLVNDVCKKILSYNNISTENKPEIILEFKGYQLAGSTAEQPIWGYDVPLIHGDFVGGIDENNNRIGEKGTGLVHIAGAHGVDDFNLSMTHQLTVKDWVDESGYYLQDLDNDLGGLYALKSQGLVIDILGSKVLAKEEYVHRYPYSERGKNPIIFKLTAQWFIDIDQSGIREKAQNLVENIHWIPATGKNRMLGMLKTRKEWLISRQRYWGIPLTWFFHKDTGEILPYDNYGPSIVKKIIESIEDHSYNLWYSYDNQQLAKKFLPPAIANDYLACKDILDVWFESGMTHDYVVRCGNQKLIADLYIEGSDQHRGWFQSSLLTSVALYNKAPYHSVLTHGFVLDAYRQKMSKSLGNVVSLRDCCENIGCDIMRIWVAMADFTEEITFNDHIINTAKDIYGSIRNRCKFLLAVLNGNDNHWNEFNYDELSDFDKYILAKMYLLHGDIEKKIKVYDFRSSFMMLNEFFNHDLSKIYFIYLKDIVYCDGKDSKRRQNILKIINKILQFVVYHGKIFLPFLMEDVFIHYQKENHQWLDTKCTLQLKFSPDELWNNKEILNTMEQCLIIANTVMNNVEKAIQNSIIKNKSEAIIRGNYGDNKHILMDLCKVSDFIDGEEQIILTHKKKCDRCWNYIIENDDELCLRCSILENKVNDNVIIS